MATKSDTILAIAREHEQAELALDMERIMATLVKNPTYFWYPQSLRIEGETAVREMYKRMAPIILSQGEHMASQVNKFFAVGEDQLTAETEFECAMVDGSLDRVRIGSFIPFDDGLMTGETLYTCDKFAALMNAYVFDDDFRRLPGVAQL